MTKNQTFSLPAPDCKAEALSHFRFGPFEDGVILTTDQGTWHWLTPEDFNAFIADSLPEDSNTLGDLREKGFIRLHTNLEEIGISVQRRKSFLGIGPELHQIFLRDAHGALSIETAKAVVDHAMQSTSSILHFELIQQDGELDAGLFDFIASYAMEKNRYENKNIKWTARAARSTLTQAAIATIVKHKAVLHTTLDGSGPDLNLDDLTLEATLHVDSTHLGKAEIHCKAIAASGVSTVFMEPDLHSDKAIGPEDFSDFYTEALDFLLASPDGPTEGHATALASTILRNEPSLNPAQRAPGGAGLNLHAYDSQGRIFPNAKAAELGDSGMLQLGVAGHSTYQDTLNHPTLKTLVMASILDCLPGFHNHWATPFLSVDPVESYVETGDLFEKFPSSDRVKTDLARLKAVMSLVTASDETRRLVLESWLSA